jgi:hypothetical protein
MASSFKIMKHPSKPPKAFAALVIGMLGFTLASAYIFVSAAPTKISEQNSQPAISKIGLISSDAKGKNSTETFVWNGKPVAVKYSAATSKLQMSAQATNFSRKAPIWYAFDSFSLVSKVITPAMIEKMALADAPDANSSLWQKTQSATVSNLPLEKDEKRILVVYISNADPKSVMNKGIVDGLAYIVVQDGTTELQGAVTSSAGALWVNSVSTNLGNTTYIMGATQKPLFSFSVGASPEADLKLDRFTVNLNITAPGVSTANLLGVVNKLRLLDGKKAVGSTVPALISVNNDGQAIFTNLNFVIPKGEKRTLTIVGDISEQPDVFSGAVITASTATDLIAADGLPAIAAVEVKSGVTANIVTSAPKSLVSFGNSVTVYKTAIALALVNGSSPSAGSGSLVARFAVSNAANVNSQSAKIVKLKITPETTLKQNPGIVRTMRVYRTENLTYANLIGTFEFGDKTCLLGSGCSAEIDLSSKAMLSSIEEGDYQVYSITLDTKDAVAKSELALNIAVTSWSDGVTENIVGDTAKLSVKSNKIIY